MTTSADENIMADTDMAGPLVFCLVLGFCLLLVSALRLSLLSPLRHMPSATHS